MGWQVSVELSDNEKNISNLNSFGFVINIVWNKIKSIEKIEIWKI